MLLLTNIDQVNAVDENDFNKIGDILFESLSVKRIYKKESVVDYKEYAIDAIAELLKKMLIYDSSMPKHSKLDIINLLDKLKTQKENLELLKSNISATDLQQASERLSKKSQSAFESK